MYSNIIIVLSQNFTRHVTNLISSHLFTPYTMVLTSSLYSFTNNLISIFQIKVSILGPVGYGPTTLPLRDSHSIIIHNQCLIYVNLYFIYFIIHHLNFLPITSDHTKTSPIYPPHYEILIHTTGNPTKAYVALSTILSS